MATINFDAVELQRRHSSPVVIIEAKPGLARKRYLETLLEQMPRHPHTFFTDCDFETGGPWSGVIDLLAQILRTAKSQRPDLIQKYALELSYVLPEFTSAIPSSRINLTDASHGEERIRSYSADRALRIVHGLIDLVSNWKLESAPNIPWTIVCDGYDCSGSMSREFFFQLMRSRGESLHLQLVAGVSPGHGQAVQERFRTFKTQISTIHVEEESLPSLTPEAAAQQAIELEKQIGDDRIQKQVHFSELIRLWNKAGRPDKVLHLRYFAMALFLHMGLYEDVLRYGEGLVQMAAEHAFEDVDLRWRITMKILNGCMGTQKPKEGLELAHQADRELSTHVSPAQRIELWYVMAMFYARFLKPRDFAKGEEYLDRGLAEIEQAGLSPEEYHFQSVFNRNGVAMIRTFQGRHLDALELCRSGLARMNAHIPADRHRLHRSVLVYNAAQVYAAVGDRDKAIEYYSTAIAMDPNYSEYYNERGNLLLQLERFEEAQADYLKAITLSPPYFEVFVNLGQCYRNMGDFTEAIKYYSCALDLNPNLILALLGRAQCYEQLAQANEAMTDYSQAIDLDPSTWEAFASRGILQYEAGNLAASLSDLNQALELNTDQIALYKNRSIVLTDLGRHSEAAGDLQAALALGPDNDEKNDLQARLEVALQSRMTRPIT
jgi:tetratricopeptide (TPR) repeat protein